MKTKLVITLFGLILFLCSCDTCKDCVNNLDNLIGEFTEYEEGDIVQFINNDSIVQDTVTIEYRSPDGKYDCCGSKDGSYDCSGGYNINLGDFSIGLYQEPNLYKNKVYERARLGSCPFDLVDTVTYNYKGQEIEVKYYMHRYNTFEKKNYYDFYITFENKLLEYSYKEAEIIERWVLKE